MKKNEILEQVENLVNGIRWYVENGYIINSIYSNNEEVIVNVFKNGNEEILSSRLKLLLAFSYTAFANKAGHSLFEPKRR